MDQLLVACHAQTLNLFVESFLKMVQKLLESTDPQLQILATQSVSNNYSRIYHYYQLYLIRMYTFCFSLLDLPTLKKTHPLIIHVMISLYQNILQCATPIMMIPLYVSKSDLLEFKDCRYKYHRMLWSAIYINQCTFCILYIENCSRNYQLCIFHTGCCEENSLR